ncbi:MAG: type II secretion system protein [Candidatus Andersenbacteria bacterium]|nr:type II secretion system protein [Candidatus Andersenbacteria bacterium]
MLERVRHNPQSSETFQSDKNYGALSRGFTLIELLLVIAILAILFILVFVAVRSMTKRSQDVKIRSDVRQLRLLAEEVFDNAGASYENWDVNPLITSQVDTLRQDIESAHSTVGTHSVLIANRETEYCISAELVAKNDGTHWCVDATGRFRPTTGHCNDPGDPDIPLVCPGS